MERLGEWVLAWLLSGAASTCVWVLARRSGLDRPRAWLLAAALFLAPVGLAVTGPNSFVYASDFAVPVFVVMAMAKWRCAPKPARRIAVLLFFALGFLPAISGVTFGRTSVSVMFALINFWRAMGATSALVVFSSTPMPYRGERIAILIPAAPALFIALAMGLQNIGLSTNVLAGAGAERLRESAIQMAVLGMFRGSIGIVCTFAIAAFLASARSPLVHWVAALVAAMAGTFAVVVIGSKTSLLVALLFAVLAPVVFGKAFRSRSAARNVALFLLIGTVLLYVAPWQTNRLFQNKSATTALGMFSHEQASLATYEYRTVLWKWSLQQLEFDPLILAGVWTELPQPTLGYYHNEYLAVLMNGGVLGLLLYVGALALAFRALLRARTDSPLRMFTVLLFLGGLVHGWTVSNLVPAILFPVVTYTSLIALGLALRVDASRPGSRFEQRALSGCAEEIRALPDGMDDIRRQDSKSGPKGSQPRSQDQGRCQLNNN